MSQSATFPTFELSRAPFGDNEELYQEILRVIEALQEFQTHIYDSSRSTRVFSDPNRDFTIESGETAMQPNLTIPTGQTYTVDSGGELHVSRLLTVDGTLIVNGTAYVS